MCATICLRSRDGERCALPDRWPKHTTITHTHTHARCHTDGERVQLHISLAFTPSTSKRHRWLAFFFQCGSLHGTRSLVYIHPFFLDYNSLFFFSLDVRVVLSCVCVYRYFSYFFFFSLLPTFCHSTFYYLLFFFWRRNACSSHQIPQSTTKLVFVCFVKRCSVHI